MIKKNIFIFLGAIGGLLNIIADFFLGCYKPLETNTGLSSIDFYGEAIYASDRVLITGAFLVIIATPLLAFGYYGILKNIKEDNKIIKVSLNISLIILLILGSIMHLLSTIMILIYKYTNSYDLVNLINNSFFVPVMIMFIISVLFLIRYIVMNILKDKSLYPRWSLFFNVLIWAIIFLLISLPLKNISFGNGLKTACISIGHLIMFTSLLFIKKKEAYEAPVEETL